MNGSHEAGSRTGWLRPAIREAGALLALALVPAVAAAFLHPRRPAWSEDASLATQVTWATVEGWTAPRLIVDAREPAQYAQGHIPGALPLSEDHWDADRGGVAAVWQPGVRIVVYCASPSCGTAESVARRLRRDLGTETVYVLKGGWNTWRESPGNR